LDSVKKWISDNNEALALFENASGKPYCWRQAPEEDWNTSGIFNPHFSVMRSLTIALSWRAKLHSMEEDYEQSFRDVLISYRVSNQFNDPAKTMTELLVAASLKSASIESGFEILSNKQIDADKLKKFQMQLEEVISESDSRMYLDIEGLCIKDMIQRVFSDNGKGNGHLIPKAYRKMYRELAMVGFSAGSRTSSSGSTASSVWGWIKETLLGWIGDVFARLRSKFKGDGELSDFEIVMLSLTGPDREQTTRKLDEVINYLNKMQNKSPWQLNNEGIDIKKQLEGELADFLVLDGWQGFYRVPVILQRAKTCELALLTTVASMQYKANKGFYPKSLSELVNANYLSELPMDPFNDGPLTYKKIGDDFTLYSFGPDFDDDGGEIEWNRYGRISMWGKEGDTVFWPRPKETEEQRRKRFKEQYGHEPEEILESSLKGEDTNDFNDIIIDSNNGN